MRTTRPALSRSIVPVVVGLLFVFGGLRGPAGAQDAPAPPSDAALPWPGDSRAALEVPARVWADATASIERTARPLGFSAEEMANYGRDACITRPIAVLFRDVRAVPRWTGKMTDDLLAVASDPAEMVRIGYGLSDAVAGRNFAKPTGTEWGPSWLPATTSPIDALDRVLARLVEVAGPGTPPAEPLSDAARRAWKELPEPAQRLLVRCLVGCAEALPVLREAFDERFLAETVGWNDVSNLTPTRLYRLAMAPWLDDENPAATPPRASFELLRRVDRDALCFASVICLSHVGLGLSEWKKARETLDFAHVDLAGSTIETPFGVVRLLGTGSDDVASDAAPVLLSLDLGGDDVYRGRQAASAGPQAPISLLIDLGGDDRYEAADTVGSMGFGLFGLGALFDLGGNDKYAVKSSGLGCGCYGTGVLCDEAGKDTYLAGDRWTEGSAHVGVGLLADLAGDDRYECAQQSQGLGSTYGGGILLDLAGNDEYLARDDGNREKIYLDQSVAMSQGCGFGRRADLGDGHSLAGGVGVLLDAAGDDRYHAQCWAQGAAYWWAVGILEDRGGNDVYENGKYSLGAGAHFAIGCQVDLSGDDAYNQGVATAVNQYQGHARDGSIGISIDGDGNDRYQLRTHCAGSGDLCSVGLFWDRRGDDVYDVRWSPLGPPNGWTETPPMGSATTGEPLRSFRDDLATYGVFLDTGGHDAYRWTVVPPADKPAAPAPAPAAPGTPAPASGAPPAAPPADFDREPATKPGQDDATWRYHPGPRSFGVGIDRAVYPPADSPPAVSSPEKSPPEKPKPSR